MSGYEQISRTIGSLRAEDVLRHAAGVARSMVRRVDNVTRFDERTFGLAYRPVLHDRFNALMRYSRVQDLRPPGAGQVEAVDRLFEVYSLDTVFDFTARWQWCPSWPAATRRRPSAPSRRRRRAPS